jgi:hypothetical protein
MSSTWSAVSDHISVCFGSFCGLARVFSYGVHGLLVLQRKKDTSKRRYIYITLKAPRPLWKVITFTSLWTSHLSKQANCFCAQYFYLWAIRVRVIWQSFTKGFKEQYKHTKILNFINIILIHICIISINLEYRKHECVHRISQFL